MHPISHYIGKPYDRTHYNCWHFFAELQQQVFGRHVGTHAIDVSDIRQVANYVNTVAQTPAWQKLTIAEHGCAVLMRRSRQPIHLGCWLAIDGGQVIHNMDGFGVVCQSPLALLQHGWHIEGYYRCTLS